MMNNISFKYTKNTSCESSGYFRRLPKILDNQRFLAQKIRLTSQTSGSRYMYGSAHTTSLFGTTRSSHAMNARPLTILPRTDAQQKAHNI
uniref:Uncharacterized protein n=1 Tax=Romanomermis culicivorax TaxID=13658 RepID=A0A915J2P4_ROMCU